MKVRLLLALAMLPLFCAGQYNWQPLLSSPKSPRCDDMYFVNPKVGWVVNPNYDGPRGRIFKTTDGGETWQMQEGDGAPYFRSVGFADEMTGWVGSLYATSVTDTSVLWETTDGGSSWHYANLPYPHPAGICGISVVNTDVIYGYGRFYGPAGYVKTINKGASWEFKNMSAYAGGFVDGFFYDKDTGFIGGCTHNQKGLILSTHDGGTTWDTVYMSTRPLADSDCVWKIVFPTPDVGYASLQDWSARTSFNSYILKTTDRGRTWTEMPCVPNYNIQGIGFINNNVGWIGGDPNLPNYKTTDGGASWHPDYTFGILTPPYHDYPNGFHPGYAVNRFRRFGDTLMYASGKTIYKLNTNETSAGMTNGPEAMMLTNFPNPFNNHTTISYNLPTSATDVVLEIWDIKGVKVFERLIGTKPQGKHNYTFAEALPPGVFYYSVRTSTYSSIKKMIVER